jgi:hypothetical protein
VAASTADHTPAVTSFVCVHFDSLPHTRPLDAFLNQALYHVAPLCDENYRRRGNFSILPPLHDGMGVCQSPYLGGDPYTLILHFEFFSQLLQAFRALPHVPYERYCVDPELFPGLILFNGHNAFFDCPRCGHDDVTVLQGHLCCYIRVRDCSNRALGISFGIHDPDLGRCLLVEERCVDR